MTHKSKRRGFTLVELLVVIGIIALLMSMLLPALGSARRQSNTVKCLAHLRQIGLGFQLYANNNKDAFPVVRQDTPEVNGVPTNVTNRYWTDMLLPYVSKTGAMNFQFNRNSPQGVEQFRTARLSVMWGCPEWLGICGTVEADGISIFESGYAMNHYPTATPTHPASVAAMPPTDEWQFRWATIAHGKYWKKTQWTKPSERLLVADAKLWVLFVNATNNQGIITGQDVPRVSTPTGPGNSHLDRYRHGKYPRQAGNLYATRGGKEAFNILYADGHAATCLDIRQGYKAIRMRYP